MLKFQYGFNFVGEIDCKISKVKIHLFLSIFYRKMLIYWKMIEPQK